MIVVSVVSGYHVLMVIQRYNVSTRVNRLRETHVLCSRNDVAMTAGDPAHPDK